MLKLNVGFNRKTGEANYGSRGASVNLDLELDSGLVDQPERLKDRVRELFAMAKASVDEELGGSATTDNTGHTANGNGQRRDATRKATASQVRAIHAIVDRQRLDLPALLHGRYGISQASELSITEASQLIDELKSQANGNGSGRTPMISSAILPTPRVRDYLSFSAMNLYRSCPLRYRFRYLDGLPEEAVSASLVFGSACHRSVELHFNRLLAGEPLPSLDELLTAYNDAWHDQLEVAQVQFNKDDDVGTLSKLASRMLEAFRNSPAAQPVGHVIGVEEELRGSIIPGVPDLLGRIDLLIETDDVVTINDLKTSRSRWSRGQAEDSAEQLLLYSELVKHLVPGKQMRLQFVVLTKTKEPVVDVHDLPVEPQRVARTKKIVERVWRSIEAGHFYPTPSVMTCTGCPYRNPCRAWAG